MVLEPIQVGSVTLDPVLVLLGLLGFAALALLAAATGFCAGCTAYRIGHRLTGRPFVSCPLPSGRATSSPRTS